MELPLVRNRAEELLEIHGFAADGWTVRFVRESWRAGYCDWSRREIGLSVDFMDRYDDDDVETVIIHELGHIAAGPTAEHGSDWAKAVRARGGKPRKSAPPLEPAGDLLRFFAILVSLIITGFTFGTLWGVLAVIIAVVAIGPKLYRRFAPLDKVYKLTAS